MRSRLLHLVSLRHWRGLVLAAAMGSLPLGAVIDRDGDSLSDVWAAHFHPLGGATADPDGDGATNAQEAVAGTDPMDAASAPAAQVRTEASGAVALRWLGVHGKRYQIETSTDLRSWSQLAGQWSGQGAALDAVVRAADAAAEPRRHWRVVAADGDTDGDGSADAEEFALGTDPNTANATPVLPDPQPGDVLWTQNPAADPLPGNKLANLAWLQPGPDGRSCVQVVLPAGTGLARYIGSFPFDMAPFRGAQIRFEATLAAEEVTPPDAAWKGVVCELGMDSRLKTYPHTSFSSTWGTYGWRTFTCDLSVPADVTNGRIFFGLQGATGKAWMTDWKIRLVRRAVTRPPVDPAWQPARHPPRRGVMLAGTAYNDVTAARFDVLQSWNVNLVRWVMGYVPADVAADPAAYDQWLDTRLDELAKALAAAESHGLKLIADLHVVTGGRQGDGSNALFYDTALQERFVAHWQKIATRCKAHPALYAFDLINEPSQAGFVPAGALDWRNLQIRAARAIRAIDPTTPIMIEVDGYDAPGNFAWMDPVEVPGVIYSVHVYQPMAFTHQGISEAWGVAGGVAYPGTINGQPFNKDTLRAYLQPVRDFQLSHQVPIVVGEFSAVRWAPGAAQYLEDLTSLFEEYGWDWCYHAFREWPGWSLEAANLPVPENLDDHVPAVTTDRMEKIRHWFDRNPRGP